MFGRVFFTAQRYASAVCCRVSVNPSVTSRCSTKIAKHGITQQCHTLVQKIYFTDAKDLGEIPTGLPKEGTKYTWSVLKPVAFDK